MFGLTSRNASVSRYDSPIGLTPSFRLRYSLDSSANRCGAALIDALSYEFVDLSQELFGESHSNLLSRHQALVYRLGIHNGMRAGCIQTTATPSPVIVRDSACGRGRGD